MHLIPFLFWGFGILPALPAEPGQDKDPVKPPTISREPAFTQKPVSAWIKDLKDQDPQTRDRALNALATMGPLAKDARPDLEKLLGETTNPSQIRTAFALWKIDRHSPSIVPALCVFLKNSDDKSRSQALQCLQQMGSDAKEAAPFLLELLLDKDDAVRVQSSKTLMAIGREVVPILIKALNHSEIKIRREAADMLGKIGYFSENAVPSLTEKLKDDDKLTRFKAAAALWKIQGEWASLLPLWLEGIKDADANVRKEILQPVLFQIQPPPKAALPIFNVCMKEGDLFFRVKAADGIWEINRQPEKVLPTLLDGLKNGSDSVRATAIQTLGRMGPQARMAIPDMIDLLKKPGQLTNALLQALARMGPEVIPQVAQLFQENNPQIDSLAAQLLAQFGKAGVAPLLQEWPTATPRRLMAILSNLGQIGPEAKDAVPQLMEELKANKKETNRLAILALGRIGPDAQPAIPMLLEKVKGSDAVLRSEAIRALTEINPAGDVLRPVITDFLNDPQMARRLIAVQWLWDKDRETKKTIPILKELIKDKTTQIQALILLGAMDNKAQEAVPALIEQLNDADRKVQQQVLSTILAIQPETKEIVPVLLAQLNDKDPMTRMKAAMDLKRTHSETGKAVSALVGMIPSIQPAFRPMLIKNLGAFGPHGKEAIPFLLDFLKDTNIGLRIQTAESLGQIDPGQVKTAAAVLLEVINRNNNPYLGNQAALALWKIDPKNPQPLAYFQKYKKINHSAFRSSTLATIKAMGPSGKDAVPLLIEGLSDPAAEVRLSAADALWTVTGQSEKVMPVLLSLLQDPENSRLHDRLIPFCGNMGPEAKEAIPSLLQIRKSKLWSKRHAVGLAIKKIDPQVAAKEGIP